jgi:1-acyl-sn-glycerol-3-phosphate acyltransferase
LNSIHDQLSLAFFLTLFLIVVTIAVRAYRQPTEYTAFERLLYAPVYCLARTLWRVEIVGRGQLSSWLKGGAVIVANHRCSLDPFFLQLAAGRRIHWMVAGEYFKNPIFGPVLEVFQAIPTNRSGADNAATKRAIRLASEGRFVGMFPEGRINRTQRPLMSIRSGAAMVAKKSETPLVPCWIEGAPSGWAVWSSLFMAAHVRVHVGAPVDVPLNKATPALSVEVDGAEATNEVHQRDFVDTDQEAMSQAMLQALRMGQHGSTKIEFASRRRNRATR